MAQVYVELNASDQNKCPSFQYTAYDYDDDERESQDEKVSQYIAATIVKHGGGRVVRIDHENAVTGSNFPNDYDYLLPALLLWNPASLCPDGIKLFKCSKCKSSVVQLPFEKCNSIRSLYGKEQVLLLVSTKFVCPEGHVYSGYDPRLLEVLPSIEMIPFALFHKSGVTRELFDYIILSVSNGSKFNVIERNLCEQYWQRHSQREHAFWNSVRQYIEKNPEHDIQDFNFEKFDPSKNKHPSNDIVTSCFLVYFMENEEYFTNCMASEIAEE